MDKKENEIYVDFLLTSQDLIQKFDLILILILILGMKK
jgi:hypothetical protein